jgi:hypothetical protein
MRKALWAILMIGVVITLDVVLANIPGPVPTSQAISNVEGSASFKGIVGNGTYSFYRYSDDPSWTLQCISSVVASGFHFFDAFHEYTTTTLIFSVQPDEEIPVNYSGPAYGLSFLILAQVNPASGEIYSIQTQGNCV